MEFAQSRSGVPGEKKWKSRLACPEVAQAAEWVRKRTLRHRTRKGDVRRVALI
jgi:hypothetical protein